MLFLVADCHVTPGSQEEREFREMLEALSRSPHDVVFLGDILDLWIAIPRYEETIHREFAEWCRRESARRRIYFLEGNHEFFVQRHRTDCFTQTAEDELLLDDILFAHGDKIQEGPFGFNRLFLGLCKSWVGLSVLTVMPFGRSFAHFVKRLMGGNHSRPLERIVLPLKRMRRWAEHKTRHSHVQQIILGHFHKPAVLEGLPNGATLRVLPAWKCTRNAALLTSQRTLDIRDWHHLL